MFSGHIANFKIGVSKVQDFGNCELSPMDIRKLIFDYALFTTGLCSYKYSLSNLWAVYYNEILMFSQSQGFSNLSEAGACYV